MSKRKSAASNVIVTILILILIASTVLVALKAWGVWDIADKLPHAHTFTDGICTVCQESEPNSALNGDNDSYQPSKVYPMARAMTMMSSQATAKYTPNYNGATATIKATITPDNASNQLVDWAVSFVNATSDWATGKTVTDYVTVSPLSDGSKTATVTCLAPFGEKIAITVTSRDNPGATAQSVCDFKQFVYAVDIAFGSGADSITASDLTGKNVVAGKVKYDSTNSAEGLATTYTLHKTEGTILATGTMSITMTLPQSVHGALVGQYGTHTPGQPPHNGAGGINCNCLVNLTLLKMSANTSLQFDQSSLQNQFVKPLTQSDVFNKLRTELVNHSYLELTVVYDTYEHSYQLPIDMSTIAIRVEGVDLDKPNIIF